jgi:hypothetical protein
MDVDRQPVLAGEIRKFGGSGGVPHRRDDPVARFAERKGRREANARAGASNENCCHALVFPRSSCALRAELVSSLPAIEAKGRQSTRAYRGFGVPPGVDR